MGVSGFLMPLASLRCFGLPRGVASGIKQPPSWCVEYLVVCLWLHRAHGRWLKLVLPAVPWASSVNAGVCIAIPEMENVQDLSGDR